MSRHYTQLSAEERGVLMALRSQDASIRVAAAVLSRAPSTIWRELRRSGEHIGQRATIICDLIRSSATIPYELASVPAVYAASQSGGASWIPTGRFGRMYAIHSP